MCIGIIGGIVAGVGSLMSGMQQSAAYKAQAKASEMEARSESEAGSYESARASERAARLQGQQVTSIAAQGLDLSGTPLDVVTDSATDAELDKRMIRANAQRKSNTSMYEAKLAKMNAKSAAIGGVIGAISPVLNSMTGTSGAFG